MQRLNLWFPRPLEAPMAVVPERVMRSMWFSARSEFPLLLRHLLSTLFGGGGRLLI